MAESYDVAIVGGGVVGCAIAHELSAYDLRVVLFERESDVARGTSGKNSGVVHTGINVPTGSLKARFNVAGAALFEDVCRALGVPFKRVGKLVVALAEADAPELDGLLARGRANGVPQLEIIDGAEVKRLEPRIAGVAALHAPTAAITCPYSLTIALAEAAALNGVDIRLDSPVTRIHAAGGSGGYEVKARTGAVQATLVINAAGLHSDRIAALAGVDRWRIYPVRGEYAILDRAKGDLITRMVYPVPPKGGAGLGVHITPTVDGNILLGPSAAYIRSKIDTRTTAEVRRELLTEAAQLLPGISAADVITAYSGVRPKLVSRSKGGFADFVIEEAPETPGMMHLVGIESPGLTAAPAIGVHVAKWVLERIPRDRKVSIQGGRRTTVRFRERSLEERAGLIESDPDYGKIVCRCELVTEREVLDAIRNPLHARSLTSLKYRSRAMMGRCQGGFCGPRIVDIMLQNGVDPASISLRGGQSWMFVGSSREVLRRANGGLAGAGSPQAVELGEAVMK